MASETRLRAQCADDGDTDREILRQIVCEERSDECAICRKILSKGCGAERRLRRMQRGGAGAAVAEHKYAFAYAVRCGHRNPDIHKGKQTR